MQRLLAHVTVVMDFIPGAAQRGGAWPVTHRCFSYRRLEICGEG